MAEIQRQTFRARDASEAVIGLRGVTARGGRVLVPKLADSPYFGIPESEWADRTRQLITEYPLDLSEIVDAVLLSWIQIFNSDIGGFKIGTDILPSPQIMGNFLHELIPLNLARKNPTHWRRDATSGEKDLVCITNSRYSTEIKTSSASKQIFGNRSFAQKTTGDGKKSKSGYYLAVNFTKFDVDKNGVILDRPYVGLIRFGWLDHSDWAGQEAASGQQSSLAAVVENTQLLTIYSAK